MAKNRWTIVLAVCLGLLATGAVYAQEAEEATEAEIVKGSGRIMEEVIVTAQKREQVLMDVGIAITALTADDISQTGLKTAQDIIQVVPGLMMQQTRGAWRRRRRSSAA